MSYYIKDAMGDLVKAKGRTRRKAQEYIDKLYGRGKYRVYQTDPDYNEAYAVIKG